MYASIQPRSVHTRLQIPVFQMLGKLTRPLHYRGIGSFSRVLSRFLPRAPVVRQVGKDAVLEFDLMDYYWSRLVFPDFEYESEIKGFIDRYVDDSFAFIDCGANIGYWSTLVASRLPRGRVVAIEASPGTFASLKRNSELNDNRFVALQAAICEQDGGHITFSLDRGHASSHIDFEHSDAAGFRVEATTLNTVYETFLPGFDGWVMVKLDVEGAEIPALRAADKLLATGRFILIYEDHGKDPESVVSRYILENLGLEVYSIMDGGMQQITDIETMNRLKTDPVEGYNFLAVSPGAMGRLGR